MTLFQKVWIVSPIDGTLFFASCVGVLASLFGLLYALLPSDLDGDDRKRDRRRKVITSIMFVTVCAVAAAYSGTRARDAVMRAVAVLRAANDARGQEQAINGGVRAWVLNDKGERLGAITLSRTAWDQLFRVLLVEDERAAAAEQRKASDAH